jgi:DNA invertase Pin-like site-specific DNA recombinase
LSLTPARKRRSSQRKTRPRGTSGALVAAGRRWVVPVRQSKKRYDDDGQLTSVSIEIQEAAARRVIAQLDSRPTSIEVVVDRASGGHGVRRDGRERLLALVDAGEVDAVLAYRADRLGRDIEDSENLWNRCATKGIFVCATDCLDLSDPIYRAVYFGRAQKDLEDRADWAVASLARRREHNKPPMKTAAAFGMRWSGDEPVPDRREWPIVQETLTRFAGGESMGSIARDFTRRRLARRNGSRLWDSAAVSSILYCTWYVGLIPDGEHPDGSIRYWDFGKVRIDEELWQRVQTRLAANRETKLHKEHSLSGLLYCGVCEGWSPMTLCYSRKVRKDGTVTERHRYRCALRVLDRALCPGGSIDAQRAEALLVPNLAALMRSDALSERRFARRSLAAAEAADERASELTRAIGQLESQRQRLLDKWMVGGVPETLYDQRMPDLTARLERLVAERERLLSGTTLSIATLRRLRAELSDEGSLTPERWFELPAGRRNAFLKLVFPYGLFVLAPRDGAPRGQVAGRLALRHAADAADAEARRQAVSST